MILEKLPCPVPSVVLKSAIVGLVPVLQHTPRVMIPELPSSVISPPLAASLPVMFETDKVVTVGIFSFLHPDKTLTTAIISIAMASWFLII